MGTRDIVRKLLRADEGFSLEPYVDMAGWLTIGIGHNLGLRADAETWNRVRFPHRSVITLSAAYKIFDDDIDWAFVALPQVIDIDVFRSLSDVRRAILLAMLFNLGRQRFETFKKMIAAVKAGDFEGVHREMLDSLWARMLPDRAAKYARAYLENTIRTEGKL